MAYKMTVTAVRKSEDTIFTDVTFTFGPDVVAVTIPHFRPATEAEVITGIKNRAASEKARLAAMKVCDTIAAAIAIGNEVVVP